jgi:hypothetical protein
MNRREILQAACGASLIPLPALAMANSLDGLPMGNELLEAYVRLSGSLDDRLIIWWMDGKQYAVINGKAKALFGMKVGMFHRFFRQPDGNFKIAFFELTYFTNLETGELLRTFDNPYTGETNTVSQTRLGPEIRLLTQDGLSSPGNPMVKDYASSMGPARVNNGMIWIPSSVEAMIKFPKPTAPEIALSIYTTVSGHVDAAFDPSQVSVPCAFSFSNAQRWIPWMRMGDIPGHLMGVADGRKMEQMSELPEDYMACAREVHSKYIDDPVATLAKQTQQILASQR